jgi:hypothetical protein
MSILSHPTLVSRKTYAVFQKNTSLTGLPGLCLELLSEQIKGWQDLREGYWTLKEIRERDVPCKGFSVRLQHNPGRIKSTLADVDGGQTKGRRCFLCLNHLPAEQKGILYRKEYLILCNPMPVFPSHFTIAHLDHRPQAAVEHMDTFLRLIADFGDQWTILYNGPQCGASAPDHLHFQVLPRRHMPMEREIREESRLDPVTMAGGVSFSRLRDLGREVLVLEGDDPAAVEQAFKGFLDGLKRSLHTEEEPMMNMAGFREAAKWRLVIFPRRKHRPDAFFREGEDRIAVSPAVIEMGGILVTPLSKDFETLDASTVEGIYREVSLDERSLRLALDAML